MKKYLSVFMLMLMLLSGLDSSLQVFASSEESNYEVQLQKAISLSKAEEFLEDLRKRESFSPAEFVKAKIKFSRLIDSLDEEIKDRELKEFMSIAKEIGKKVDVREADIVEEFDVERPLAKRVKIDYPCSI